jgi:hypothetical protein
MRSPGKQRIGLLLFCLGLAALLAAFAREPSKKPPKHPKKLPVINSFTASDRVITSGDTSTLLWDVDHATSLTITADTGNHVGDVRGKRSVEVTHDVTTVHTLTATNNFGSVTATVTVNAIVVSQAYVVPADIPGGAQSATLEDAAVFAWQEFIALNWPAVAQTGAAGDRETPDSSKMFGEVDPTLGTPLVWETFRHKVEIFPGSGTPHGGANYDALPQYVYSPNPPNAQPPELPGVGTSDGQVLPCNTASPNTPWNNLDEQSEIGLDQMFAGAGPGGQFTGQQILFQAKANRTEYNYVFQNSWYVYANVPFTATANYLKDNMQSPPPGDAGHVSFPNGTIELKAAWRQLTAAEQASGRFHTAMVRHYGFLTDGSGRPCYQDDAWGLVALHIIQKTPTAPYFIYATFGQADNLLDENGDPVEDENGTLIANQTADPLDPMITSQNAVSADPPTPSSVQTLSPATAHPTPPTNLLYYENTPANTSEPQGLVYVNRRIHSIPATIIDVNQTAHEAIMAYNQANNLSNSPWLYYKLVNVQYQPIDKPTPGVDYTAPDAATYYQANIVVETDYNLQVFSGQFQPGNVEFDDLGPNTGVVDPNNPNNIKNVVGLITDFDIQGKPFKNVIYNQKEFNMGGCMGCHGNAQVFGSDFSFILQSAGVTSTPDVAGPEKPANLDKYIRLLLPK